MPMPWLNFLDKILFSADYVRCLAFIQLFLLSSIYKGFIDTSFKLFLNIMESLEAAIFESKRHKR